MLRVVLDTNIVVSAMLRSMGLPAAVLELLLAGEARLFISEPVVAEYEEVLRRPRFALDPQIVAAALTAIRASSTLVTPQVPVIAAHDPDDNILLECAEAAHAHFLVTGNIRDFPPEWKTTRIVTARQFLEVMATPPGEVA